MKIINLYGGSGIGKSLLAADIFVQLKKNDFDVELRTEYAKDLLYEQREAILDSDQLYILAKQNMRLNILKTQNLEYVITDSPIFLSMIYNRNKNFNQEIFEQIVLELYNKYDNINFLIERNSNYRFTSNGRREKKVEDAILLDNAIKEKLDKHAIPYISIKNDKKVTNKIIEYVLKMRLNKDETKIA